MKYEILYFSGTGCTKLAAEKMNNVIIETGNTADLKSLNQTEYKGMNPHAHVLIVMFPVYANGAPGIVTDAVRNLNSIQKGKKAVVLSISAGGEVGANNGCRLKVIKELRRKGFDIIYEDMIVMPCNFAVETPYDEAIRLIENLNQKSTSLAISIIETADGERPYAVKKVSPGGRLLAGIGTLCRVTGFKIMGKCYKSDGRCTSCGLCAANCPVKNIKIIDGKPKFGWNCLVCMRCIYGCPETAIKVRVFDFVRIKNGFDIKKFIE